MESVDCWPWSEGVPSAALHKSPRRSHRAQRQGAGAVGALVLHAGRRSHLIPKQHPWLAKQLEGYELVCCEFLHNKDQSCQYPKPWRICISRQFVRLFGCPASSAHSHRVRKHEAV